MMRSLLSAVSGLTNHKTAMDVIGNNIANVNTVGFKRSSVVFADIFSQTLSSATAPSDAEGGKNPLQVGLGMSITAIKTSITGGSTQSTGRAMDYAIDGEGYFIVKAADGQNYYTRNGSLEVDSEGNLTTEDGSFVLGAMIDSTRIGTALKNLDELEKFGVAGAVSSTPAPALGQIIVDPKHFRDYSIDGNGYVKAVVIDTTGLPTGVTVGQEVTLGRVALGTFINAAGLEKAGGSLYEESSNSGSVAISYVNEGAAGKLKGGSLEMSNVDLATELTDMIIMQRGFQANSRVITTSDSMLEELVNLKR